MASSIIHYIIGKKVIEYFDFNYNDFIIGNLLPDAHDGTTYGHSLAHFYKNLTGTPKIEYKEFKKKYNDCFQNNLVLGYYSHLLSDYIWLQHDIPKFPKNLDFSSKEYTVNREILHSDYGKLNKILIEHYKLSFNDDLVIPDSILITEIDKKNLSELLNNLYYQLKSKNEGELKMITLDFVVDYIQDAIDFCTNEFHNYF